MGAYYENKKWHFSLRTNNDSLRLFDFVKVVNPEEDYLEKFSSIQFSLGFLNVKVEVRPHE